MASSETGLSAARQRPATRKSTNIPAQVLRIIFTRHCTPVQRIQKSGLLAPANLDPDMKVQINLHAEEALHFLARQSADFLEHGTLGSDHDGFLAGALHPDGGEDAREPGSL